VRDQEINLDLTMAKVGLEGELLDLIEEFSDGRIQFAFLKIKDPNTTLPKNILISWVTQAISVPIDTQDC
jgi:hypothetical protein